MVRDHDDHRSSVPSSVDRRTFLKASSGALVGVSAAGLASASDAGDERIEGELPHPDRGTMRVDESLKSLTPHYFLLTLDEDRLLELVDGSEMEESKRGELADFLKDAWREYPVERVRDGGDVVFSLADDEVTSAVAPDQNEQFANATRAVSRGYANEGDDASIQWNGGNHETMTQNTCEHFDLYNYEADDIASHSDDPDNTPCQGCSADMFPGSWAMPGWVKDKIETGLDEFAHHYGHYYDPNYYSFTMSGVTIEFDGIGAAPWYCATEMQEAEDSSYSTRREALGRALHYVQDVAVPLHSGMGIEQMNLGLHCDWEGCAAIDPYTDLHYGYENYVSRNLTSGENFIDDYDRLRIWNSDPVSVVQNCASYTNNYSYEVFHLMMDNGKNPDNWSSSTALDDLNQATENCMAEAGGYTHALVEQIYG